METIDNKWTERFSRGVTINMGGGASIALYAATVGQLKEAGIPDCCNNSTKSSF